jgi:hypothetical protein
MGLYVGIFVIGFFFGYTTLRIVRFVVELTDIVREEELWR